MRRILWTMTSVSSRLEDMIQAAEARTGVWSRRRTEVLALRIAQRLPAVQPGYQVVRDGGFVVTR